MIKWWDSGESHTLGQETSLKEQTWKNISQPLDGKA